MPFDSFIDYEALENWIDRFLDVHETIARAEVLAETVEGRPIGAVHLTDPGVSENDKEVALIVIGRHGNEIGTRVVGPAVFEWPASAAAQEILERQHIIVVPVANPDGCAHTVFGLPVYRLSGLEKRSLLPLAAAHPPDVVLDILSLGRETGMGLNWGGLEAIVIDHTADAGGGSVYPLGNGPGDDRCGCGRGISFSSSHPRTVPAFEGKSRRPCRRCIQQSHECSAL